MHPKIKARRPGALGALRCVRPPMAHDKLNATPARDARLTAGTVSGTGRHARHHVARQNQA
jgi:hypothetical protein